MICGRNIRYEDLVRASDVVITKPGYGIVAECIANKVPVLYTSRGEFPEYEILVRALEENLNTGYLPLNDFLEGCWEGPLRTLFGEERKENEVDVTGASRAAEYIRSMLS